MAAFLALPQWQQDQAYETDRAQTARQQCDLLGTVGREPRGRN